jgi:hypothetical protein
MTFCKLIFLYVRITIYASSVFVSNLIVLKLRHKESSSMAHMNTKTAEDWMKEWGGVALGAAAVIGSAAVASMIYSRKRAEQRRR